MMLIVEDKKCLVEVIKMRKYKISISGKEYYQIACKPHTAISDVLQYSKLESGLSGQITWNDLGKIEKTICPICKFGYWNYHPDAELNHSSDYRHRKALEEAEKVKV